LHNADEILLRILNLFRHHELPRDQDIKRCRALQCRASGDLQKPRAIFGGEFAVSLRNVQRNACGRAIELIFRRGFDGN